MNFGSFGCRQNDTIWHFALNRLQACFRFSSRTNAALYSFSVALRLYFWNCSKQNVREMHFARDSISFAGMPHGEKTMRLQYLTLWSIKELYLIFFTPNKKKKWDSHQTFAVLKKNGLEKIHTSEFKWFKVCLSFLRRALKRIMGFCWIAWLFSGLYKRINFIETPSFRSMFQIPSIQHHV